MYLILEKPRRSGTPGSRKVNRVRQMWLCGASCFDELFQFQFTRLKCCIARPSLKQFVPQPDSIGVHYITLAIFRDFSDSSFAKISIYMSSIDGIRLPWQSDDPA